MLTVDIICQKTGFFALNRPITVPGTLGSVPSDPFTSWITGLDWTGFVSPDLTATGDPDGDGFTNLQEFLFGTTPVAANGSLVTSENVAGGLVLHWLQRASGSSYLLQESTTMGAGDWIPSASVPVFDDQSGVPTGYERYKATLSIGAARQFFRVEGAQN